MKIIPANLNDAKAISELEKKCEMSAMWGEKNIKKEIGQSFSIVLKAVKDRNLIGFIAGKIVLEEVQINNLAVDPLFLRCGIATKLIKKIIELACQKKCSVATLEVNEINLKAVSLYNKLGFKIVGRRPKFYNNKNDAILMDLKI